MTSRSGYQLDQGDLAGKPGDGERPVDSDVGLHFSTLFDEDEDQAGNRTDDATGKAIDNSTYTGYEGVLPERTDGYPPHLDQSVFDEELERVARELGFASAAAFLADVEMGDEEEEVA